MKIKLVLLNSMFCCFLLMPIYTFAATKTIGIIVYDDVLTSDVTGPLEVFGVASKLSWFNDYDVKTISIKDVDFIETEEGLTLGADTSIDQNPTVDVLIVPSRYEMDSLLNNNELISFIQNTAESAQWLASNCSGSLLLAKAGVLDGIKATTWAGGEDDFQKMFPSVNVIHDRNLIIDNNILTSNGSIVSYQAALALLAQLSSDNKAQEVADTIQFGRLSELSF